MQAGFSFFGAAVQPSSKSHRYNRIFFLSKIHAFMKSPLLLTLLAAALASSPVFAENADRNKPMNAEADALRYEIGRAHV